MGKPVTDIVMFSGGVGSYCAAKRVIERYGKDHVRLLFTDTRMEDEDLYRFLDDAEAVLGVELVRLVEGRTPWEVFRDVKFLGNSRVDPCSKLLKRFVSDAWIQEQYPDPTTVRCNVGIDWSESHRFEKLAARKRPYVYVAPLCDHPYLTKDAMLSIVEKDGIEVPRLYDMGFAHNNCGGFCVKAGQGHFKLLLEKMPDRYREHEEREQEFQKFLGKPVTIMRKQVGGNRRPYSMKEMREDLERGCQIDSLDIGGCGCFSDVDDDEGPPRRGLLQFTDDKE